jgi:hypothetical protein
MRKLIGDRQTSQCSYTDNEAASVGWMRLHQLLKILVVHNAASLAGKINQTRQQKNPRCEIFLALGLS